MTIEYEKLEVEIIKHRKSSKLDIEEFLEHEATAKHTEIQNKLRMNDNKMNAYHQVREYIQLFVPTVCVLTSTDGKKSTKM